MSIAVLPRPAPRPPSDVAKKWIIHKMSAQSPQMRLITNLASLTTLSPIPVYETLQRQRDLLYFRKPIPARSASIKIDGDSKIA